MKDKMVTKEDLVLVAVLDFLDKHPNWIGTMTALRKRLLTNVSKINARYLPGSPSALRVVMNKIVNRLRCRRISVKFGRTSDRTRTRFVKLTAC